MADSNAMADIRGIDINKLVEGFAEEGIVLKNYCRVMSTTAREIRWYQKTAGFLTGPTTTGVTATLIANTSSKSLPVAIEPSYTRNTSYVKKYFAESPLISNEDIKDCDPDIWADMIKDGVRAVNYQVDARILTVLDASGCQTAAATGNGWNVDADGDPIQDFLAAKEAIKAYGYSTDSLVAYMNQAEEKWLLRWLINVKGSSIPGFSSDKVENGRVMELLGVKIVSSANRPTDTVTIFVPDKAVIWKEFMKTTTAVIDDPGIGKKVRIWCEGEAIRPNPYAVFKITDTIN
jgi:hypothetical protein